MSDFLRYGHVNKTKKARKCYACGEIIREGAEAHTWTSADEGSCFTEYLHVECFNDLQNHCSGCRECCECVEGYYESFMHESAINDSDCEPAKRLRDKKESEVVE